MAGAVEIPRVAARRRKLRRAAAEAKVSAGKFRRVLTGSACSSSFDWLVRFEMLLGMLCSLPCLTALGIELSTVLVRPRSDYAARASAPCAERDRRRYGVVRCCLFINTIQ